MGHVTACCTFLFLLFFLAFASGFLKNYKIKWGRIKILCTWKEDEIISQMDSHIRLCLFCIALRYVTWRNVFTRTLNQIILFNCYTFPCVYAIKMMSFRSFFKLFKYNCCIIRIFTILGAQCERNASQTLDCRNTRAPG